MFLHKRVEVLQTERVNSRVEYLQGIDVGCNGPGPDRQVPNLGVERAKPSPPHARQWC